MKIISLITAACRFPFHRKEVQMTRTRLNVTVGLALLTLLLTPALLPAADSAVVVPFFSSQKSVATGTAISGTSTYGTGVYGYTEDGYAIYGRDTGTTLGRGYGGYFTSNTGVGLFGRSTATASAMNLYMPGVYGSSRYGAGVYGIGESEGYDSYGGYFTGRNGVFGSGTYLYGGYFTGKGGVYGYASGPSYNSNSYGGYFTSANYRGLYARGASGFYAAYFDSGSSTGAGIYVLGNLTASGSKSGYVVDIAVNDGPESLETGDLVVVTGYGEPVAGEIPLVRVRKSSTAASSAIIGVVDQPFTVPPPEPAADGQNISFLDAEEDRSSQALPGPSAAMASLYDGTGIAPGEYLSIVTLGSYKAIKADADTGGAIVPGSLLVASPEPGHAMAADSPACGTVIGKALGGLSSGTGLIPVMVTLQ
jgi:hypothetical protein